MKLIERPRFIPVKSPKKQLLTHWLLIILIGISTACEDHREIDPTITPTAPAGFRHAFANVNGVNVHYVTGGQGPLVVLLHGFPQTWYEWNRIMPQLGQHYTVVAPDLRGGGLSDKPTAPNGYPKTLLAEDIHQLVRRLGFSKVKLVGHDIGLMVGYAYASMYPDEVEKLVVLDAPLPGIEPIWSLINQSPLSDHLRSFQIAGYEQNIVGNERQYLTDFYVRFANNQRLPFTPEELDIFVGAYTGANNLRGGLEWYRGFPTDIQDNQRFAQTKLTMPVLALGGDFSGPYVLPMMQSLATNVQGGTIANSGHWILEEQPQAFLERLLPFLDQ